MRYNISLVATAIVETSVQVEASSEAAARIKAIELAEAGDVVWKYDGAEDSTIEVSDVTKENNDDGVSVLISWLREG